MSSDFLGCGATKLEASDGFGIMKPKKEKMTRY